MSYRLVVLDVDGTLLNSQGVLTPRVREVVERVRAAGVVVALATGRRLRSTLPVVRELGLPLPAILNNGALVMDLEREETIYHRPLPRAVAREVAGILYGMGVPVFLYRHTLEGKDVFYELDPVYPEARAFLSRNEPYAERVPGLAAALEFDPVKVVVFDEERRIRELADHFARLPLPPHRMMVTGDRAGWLLEFYHAGCSKALGVKLLASRLGITREEIMALGDNTNDLEMLRYAGLGVAMGNAVEELKASARLVARSNDEEGVAEVLERYVLSA